MPDLADYDAVTKEIKKIFDAWSKAAKDATAALAKLKADADKEELKKQQEAAKKAVQQATDAMQKKIWNFSISPKADPKPFGNLPKIIKDVADGCDIKFGDSCVGVLPKDLKFDPPPKFKVKSGGFIVEWTLKF
jgi:hypothetical protein